MKQASFLALTALLLAPLATPVRAESGPKNVAIRDEQGREMVMGGYVALTEDNLGSIRYQPEDYRRMVRMGANFQVIRTTLGRLGGWPGREADPTYLEHLDAMVRMAREVGLKTVFKLVIYDLRPFGSAQWDAIYRNTNGTQDALVAAWSKLWLRHKDDPSVFGYDLLNEPQRGLDPDEERCCREQLLPTLRRLADAMHAISPRKWALYQPLYREIGTGEGPFLPMKEPFGRDRVIYAPHLYSMDLAIVNKTLDRYAREAALSGAPLVLGEWGPATDIAADTDPVKQTRYTQIYEATANALDRRGIGAIKAWFCGTRKPLTAKKRPAPFTWAIFSDPEPVGRVERKYITDAVARPRPLAVAGRLERYGYDFLTRTLELSLQPDATLGRTEIFVPVDRFYPDGIRVEVGAGVVLAMGPGETQWRPITRAGERHRDQARQVHWEPDTQRLVVDQWIDAAEQQTLRITPLERVAIPPKDR
jgi:hypothetical protein